MLALVVVLAAGFAKAARAQGGPPLLTDDPDTPGPGYWEINVAMTVETSEDVREFEAPLADINYGVGRRIQLKFEMPWLSVDAEHERAHSGPGNSVAGVKWRFLGEEGRAVAWSIYPQMEWNTSESMATRGLVDGKRRLILPTELTLETGRVEINTEAGRVVVDGEKDGWLGGLSSEITVPHGLELLGELHAEKEASAAADVVVNFGARHKLTGQLVLLASVGTFVRGAEDHRGHFRSYFGLQVNLPGQYGFSASSKP